MTNRRRTRGDLTELTSALEALVPAPYLCYAPILAEGLEALLSGLPAEESSALRGRLRSSQGTPLDALMLLLRACPTLHKLGQVLARDRRIAPGVRLRLQALEVLPGPAPDVVRALARQELDGATASLRLGNPEASVRLRNPEASLRLDAHRALEGSVAIVVPFAFAADGGQRGVLKLLKPGVEDRLARELALWPRVGEVVEEACRRAGLAVPPLREMAEEVKRLLLQEIDLAGEQANLRAAADLATLPGVAVPEVMPLSRPRMTVMTEIAGPPVTVWSQSASRSERHRLGRRLLEVLVARPLFTAEGAALFHADPHAGNLVVTAGGSLGLLDWSLVGRLGKDARVRLMQALAGAVTLDRGRIATAVAGLAPGGVDHTRLRDVVAAAVRRVRRGTWPGLRWLLDLLDQAAQQANARFPADTLLFRKALHTLEGVLADTSPRLALEPALAGAALGELVREVPWRLRLSPQSRAFGSQLSSLELLGLGFGGPGAAVRFWTQTWSELLAGGSETFDRLRRP